jgi:hypothetical protein
LAASFEDFGLYESVFGEQAEIIVNAHPDFGSQVVHCIYRVSGYRGRNELFSRIGRGVGRTGGAGFTFCIVGIHGDHIHAICGLRTAGEKRVAFRLFRHFGQRPIRYSVEKAEAWTFDRFKRMWNYLETGTRR